jgi:hypothetical protein
VSFSFLSVCASRFSVSIFRPAPAFFLLAASEAQVSSRIAHLCSVPDPHYHMICNTCVGRVSQTRTTFLSFSEHPPPIMQHFKLPRKEAVSSAFSIVPHSAPLSQAHSCTSRAGLDVTFADGSRTAGGGVGGLRPATASVDAMHVLLGPAPRPRDSCSLTLYFSQQSGSM